jgi:hypothetical protein
VLGGGGLVTEWDGYAMLFDGYHPTFRYSPALPQAGFISGEVGGGQFMNSAFTIDQALNHPVWGALPALFDPAGVEFPYTTYNADLSDWDVVATFTGAGILPNFPNQVFPAIIAGRTLPVVGMAFDWGDGAFDPTLETLYQQAVEWSGTVGLRTTAVPEPGTLTLFATGLAILGMAARRQKRQPGQA